MRSAMGRSNLRIEESCPAGGEPFKALGKTGLDNNKHPVGRNGNDVFKNLFIGEENGNLDSCSY